MSTEIQPTGQQPLSPFVAQLLTAQAAFTQQVTDAAFDGLTEDLARVRATLAAVRDGVIAQIDGDVMPTPRAIERALWPTDEVVAQYRKDGAE